MTDEHDTKTEQEEVQGAETDEKTVDESQSTLTEEERISQERDEYLAGWQRAQADIANLKKRHETERKMFTTLGKEQLLGDLIPMLDNFEAAFGNKDAWEAVDANWRMGIEYIYAQFQAVLRENGVEQFGEVGDAFDQNLHEAMEGEGDTISVVMQKGYKIGERIVRPAKVKLG